MFSGSSKVFNFVKGFLRVRLRRSKCCLKVLQRILNDYYRLLKGFSKCSKPVKGFLNVLFRAFFSRSKALQKLFKWFLIVFKCYWVPPYPPWVLTLFDVQCLLCVFTMIMDVCIYVVLFKNWVFIYLIWISKVYFLSWYK